MNMIVNIQHATVYLPPGQAADAVLSEVSPMASAVGVALSSIPEIGQHWPEQGGIRAAYMPPEGDKPGYSIIVPTDDAAYREELKWGPTDKDVEGLSARDGKANTELLCAAKTKHPAAAFCAGLALNGFKDYYLMSRREASLLAGGVPHLFTPGYHWTSTQYSAFNAFVQGFSGGYQSHGFKDDTWRVRAVRRFVH